ncbi:MAG: hypothetical protein ACI9UT_002208 [Flavobacteriales bacterium]|jgi:uncharacterized protein (DUF1330 family)
MSIISKLEITHMSVLIIVDLTPTDKEQLSAYSAKASATLIPYAGEFIAKGAIEVLHGEALFQTKVVIQFPDRDKALNWYRSDAYQKLIPVRERGMQSQFHLIAE